MFQGFLSRYRKEPFLWVTLMSAGILYALISWVNHYCFRTYTLDLGAYTSALFDYAHFRWADSGAFKDVPENLLADHFDLYLPLFSPFIYLFGTYTLLVAQWLAVLFGGLGVYRYFDFTHPGKKTKYFALLYFLLFFGIFAAISFDYHSNVVASMLVPWLFLAFKKEQIGKIIAWSVLIVIAKENMSLWLCFIALGLSYLHWSTTKLRQIAIFIAALSAVYFVFITSWIMPSLSRLGSYPHFHYSVLGTNSADALVYLASHPIESFRLLFVNHSGNPSNDFVKTEWWFIFLATAFFCIRKPIYIFMLIPILVQKLFHDDVAMWGINQHYAIECAPILAIGTFEVLGSYRLSKGWLLIPVAISFCCSIVVMDNTLAYSDKTRIRIYKSAHYNREFSIAEAYQILKKIPSTAIISAQSAFVPHLALRDHTYQFPIIRNAEYIMISKEEIPYPMTKTDFVAKYKQLMASPDWKCLVNNTEFLLLKRKKR